MAYSNESIMRSNNAYQILRILMEEKSCSEDLEASIEPIKSRSSLRNLLRKMDGNDIIKQVQTPSGEDNRKKFYSANLEGLFNLWINLLRFEVSEVLEARNLDFDPDKVRDVDSEITEFNPEVEKSAGIHSSQMNTSNRIEKDDRFSLLKSLDIFRYAYTSKENLKPFFEVYVEEYLDFNDRSTIRNMLVDDLKAGLSFSNYSSKVEEDELKNLFKLLNFISGNSKGIRAVDIAVERTE